MADFTLVGIIDVTDELVYADQIDAEFVDPNIDVTFQQDGFVANPIVEDRFIDADIDVLGDMLVGALAADEDSVLTDRIQLGGDLYKTISGGITEANIAEPPILMGVELVGTDDGFDVDAEILDPNIDVGYVLDGGLNFEYFIGAGEAGGEFIDVGLEIHPTEGEVRTIGNRSSPPFVYFDGSNFVSHSDDTNTDLNGGTAFSIAVVFTPEAVNNGLTGVVVGKHGPGNTQFGWKLQWDATTGEVTATVSSALDGTDRAERTTNVGSGGIRVRTVVVMTYDSATINLHVNGAQSQGAQTDFGTPGSMVTTTALFGFGAEDIATTPATFYRGLVHGCWIFDDVLSSGEANSIDQSGQLPDALRDSNLVVEFNPYDIESNLATTAYFKWLDRENSLALNGGGTGTIHVLTNTADAPMLFSDIWDINFANSTLIGADTNLTCNYPLNSDADDKSEDGTFRLYSPPTFVTNPQIPSAYRDERPDITIFVRGRRVSGSSTDIVWIELLGLQLFNDGNSNETFVFVGDVGTPDRYEYGDALAINGGAAVFALRYNSQDDNITLFIGTQKIEENQVTTNGSAITTTGLFLTDTCDYRDAAIVPSCLSDAHIAAVLLGFQPEVRSVDLEGDAGLRRFIQAALQAFNDPDLLVQNPVGYLPTRESDDQTPSPPALPETLPPTGTLELLAQPNDGDQFVVNDGTTTVTFEFESGGGVSGGATAVNIGGGVSTTMDNLVTAVNGSALDIVASATVNHDATGDGLTNNAYTNLTHNQSGDADLNLPITIPVNASGNLIATGMSGLLLREEATQQQPLDQRPVELSGDMEVQFVDAPYAVLEPEPDDTGGGALPAFLNPQPTIVSVTADAAHNVVAVANAGPTDAGDVRTWWEVELITNDTEILIRIDEQDNSFSVNHDHIDTFTIPLGQDWDEKRIRFVIQSQLDPDQIWRSLFLRMEGDEFDNAPAELLVLPGNPAPADPPPTLLAVTLAEQQFVLEEAERAALETVQLSARSRYKLTRIFRNDDLDPRIAGRNEDGFEFGLMSVLDDFTTLGDQFRVHRVTQQDIGFLDRVAVRFYGPGFETMWWAIAYANLIVDPEVDMFVGQELVIPNREILLQYIGRKPEPVGR